MVGRILRSADFQRVLAAPTRLRSAHFALHHVSARPSAPAGRRRKASDPELSTGDAPSCPPPVDEYRDEVAERCVEAPGGGMAPGLWLGLVVPKRHARRAVTRSLLKRQMREVLRAQSDTLPPGLWVLRLKASFDRQRFTSPASPWLREQARAELAQLVQRAALQA